MRRVHVSTLAVAALAMASQVAAAQGGMDETTRKVEGGGIKVPGWMGKADGSGKVEEAKLTKEGNVFHVTTGPAVTYWNPANKASGDYTVKATFTEPKYMNLNDHPHPYGIAIGGNNTGTPEETSMYCAAYGNGNFIVRGFGPAPFQLNGRRGEANAAVHKAAGPGEPVTQDIAISVKGDRVECSINGTVVGGYDKPAVVGAGKLSSTDGSYGLRFAHNTEVMVTGFTMTKNSFRVKFTSISVRTSTGSPLSSVGAYRH